MEELCLVVLDVYFAPFERSGHDSSSYCIYYVLEIAVQALFLTSLVRYSVVKTQTQRLSDSKPKNCQLHLQLGQVKFLILQNSCFAFLKRVLELLPNSFRYLNITIQSDILDSRREKITFPKTFETFRRTQNEF